MANSRSRTADIQLDILQSEGTLKDYCHQVVRLRNPVLLAKLGS